MTRELLQQALDALESLQGGCTDSNDGTVEAITVWCPELIDALRSALAAPQPEPVTFEQAWATYEAKGYQYGKDALEQVRFGWEIAHEFAIAAPPAAPAPAAPDLKHKPTVQRLMDLARKFRATPGDLYDGAYKELQQACYEALSAAPAVREPLTDEQIDALWRAPMSADWEHREFARAIEAHHGIGGGGK